MGLWKENNSTAVPTRSDVVRGDRGADEDRRPRPLAFAEVMLPVPRADEAHLLGKHRIADVVGVDVLLGVCRLRVVADCVEQ